MVKKCRVCQERKPFQAFYPKTGREQYVDSAAGYSHSCKICTVDTNTAYRNRNPEKAKAADDNSRLKRVYGIDLNQYNQMFAIQEGKCLGCKRHQSELKFKLAVDHCHESGAIRGLLCISCNAALGNVRDDVEVLENLKSYLKKSSGLAAQTSTTILKLSQKVG
jgi:Autographiviridae endonuclease VII